MTTPRMWICFVGGLECDWVVVVDPEEILRQVGQGPVRGGHEGDQAINRALSRSAGFPKFSDA
ncbi:hypothetical protein [Nonomuraea dietziae]|uniref:Uncharacterized protein n=1 Tax=Nonomuraea dietziae TaxID=65515 RepID=A0A7W5UUS4_9ACTN|nr:hypothetical protein [Nonomuraea dietziae]MBB3725007.1 hypothetical protein [Nonomuraea dietziae]